MCIPWGKERTLKVATVGFVGFLETGRIRAGTSQKSVGQRRVSGTMSSES